MLNNIFSLFIIFSLLVITLFVENSSELALTIKTLAQQIVWLAKLSPK